MSILKRILSLLKRSKPKDVFGLFDNPDASKHDNRVFAIATEAGVLLFSNTPKGKKAQGSYLQSLADSFFNLTKIQETLRIYEIDLPTKRMAELVDNCIDKLSKADLRSEDTQLRRSVVSFTPDKFVGPEVLEGAVCKDKFDIRPDFHNFDRLTKEFSLGISPRNLGDSIKAWQNAPLSAHDFGYTALQKEAKVMAADILQSEFHLHGGEFSLSGRKVVSTIERNQKQDLEFSTLDGEIDKRQERSQVKHVPSITAKKEKKQLIL